MSGEEYQIRPQFERMQGILHARLVDHLASLGVDTFVQSVQRRGAAEQNPASPAPSIDNYGGGEVPSAPQITGEVA